MNDFDVHGGEAGKRKANEETRDMSGREILMAEVKQRRGGAEYNG